MEEFPPNSKKPPGSREAPKKIERVTSATATRRKKSLWKQFRSTFIGGDARTATEYVVLQVLIPAAKDALVDAGSSMVERLIYGEHRTARRRGGPQSGPMGVVDYRSQSMREDRPSTSRGMTRTSRPQRARHGFDDIVLSSRVEAEEVLGRLYDILSQYEQVSVADLYDLTGLESTHTDKKWGWTDLHGAAAERLRSGDFLLDLPDPEYF